MTPELLWVIPFVALLVSIAVFPLANKHWWEKNYPLVSFGLGGIVVFYYLFILKNPFSGKIKKTGFEFGRSFKNEPDFGARFYFIPIPG